MQSREYREKLMKGKAERRLNNVMWAHVQCSNVVCVITSKEF